MEICALIYLMLPAAMFIIGWLKPSLALPLCVLLGVSFFGYIRIDDSTQTGHFKFKENRNKIIIILLVMLFWVICSGVGGFIWQNLWDHKFRNAVFMDLVANDWPVVRENATLCYYLGFWLPAALVGKLFGLEAGYLFQVIWAYIGVVLAIFLAFKYLGKISIRTAVLMIFFSGLDVCIYFIRTMVTQADLWECIRALTHGVHIELQAKYFNSSSNTTLLFWLYNQAIPLWVGFLLILQQKKNQIMIFIYALLFLFAPFPCVAIFPLIIYLFFKNMKRTARHNIWHAIMKEVFTCEVIWSALFVCIVGLYYMSNIAAGKIGFLGFNSETIPLFLLSFACEYGVYLLFCKENKQDPILWILLSMTVCCSFIVMGNSFDFAWRTCIPLSFYLMLLVARKLNAIQPRRLKNLLLIIILLFGAVTPGTEMIRTVRGEWNVLTNEMHARSDDLDSVFTRENNECYENFIGSADSFFSQYLSKE